MNYYMLFSSISSINMEKQRKIQNIISKLKEKYTSTNNTIHINGKYIDINISAHDNYCVVITKNDTKEQHYMTFINIETIEK